MLISDCLCRRVAEMEEKLEGLLNLLAAQTGVTVTPPLDNSSNSNSTSTNPASTPESTRDQIDLPLPNFDGGTGTDTNTSFPNSFFPSTANQNQSPQIGIINSINNHFSLSSNSHLDKIQDVISRGVVQYAQAEEALCRFRGGCASFLFIVVPEGMSVDTLRRHRPFLLLSILVGEILACHPHFTL